MTREEAYNRIDAIIARHEIDDEYVTITSIIDYDALRLARKLLEQEPKTGYISIGDVMSVFDDFMCGEVDENDTETFLEMLKDKAESEE